MKISHVKSRVVLSILIIWFITASVIAAEEQSVGYAVKDNRNFENNYRSYISPALEKAIAMEMANQDKTLNAITQQEKNLAVRKSSPAGATITGDVCADLDYSKVTGKNAFAKAEIIELTPDGNTLVFSPDGSQRCHTGPVISPDQIESVGSAMPAFDVIIVPSGSSIRSVDNRYFVTRNGDLLLTVIDNSGQANQVNSISSTEAIPAAAARAWIEWAQDTSISRIRYFSALWRVPHSPNLADFNSANMVWNGLDGSNGEGLIQPVAAFNYYEHGSSARNRWTGAAWGVKEPLKFVSTPIPLNENDEIQGSMLWIPGLNEWLVALVDRTSGQMTYHFTNSAIRTPLNNIEAYVVYEGPGITTDNQKSGDMPFYSMTFLNSYYLPVSPSWSPRTNSLNSQWHPYVHGLDVDTSAVPSAVTLLTSKHYTITASAGSHGVISPSGATSILAGDEQDFSITPESGYTTDQILVDNSMVSQQNPYPFENVQADHTIAVTFKPATSPSIGWNWATDGWGDWQHTYSYSGTEVGYNGEYGPVMVDNHGEHGTESNLLAGSTQSSVWKTFTDPSGTGWNTVEFSGLLSGSDVPGGRWMTMDINDNQVFGGTASDTPPGNGVPFTITRTFPQSSSVTVKIASGQNPAWGPRFLMQFYSVKLSNSKSLTAMAKSDEIPFVIPDGTGLVTNVTSQTQ